MPKKVHRCVTKIKRAHQMSEQKAWATCYAAQKKKRKKGK